MSKLTCSNFFMKIFLQWFLSMANSGSCAEITAKNSQKCKFYNSQEQNLGIDFKIWVFNRNFSEETFNYKNNLWILFLFKLLENSSNLEFWGLSQFFDCFWGNRSWLFNNFRNFVFLRLILVDYFFFNKGVALLRFLIFLKDFWKDLRKFFFSKDKPKKKFVNELMSLKIALSEENLEEEAWSWKITWL